MRQVLSTSPCPEFQSQPHPSLPLATSIRTSFISTQSENLNTDKTRTGRQRQGPALSRLPCCFLVWVQSWHPGVPGWHTSLLTLYRLMWTQCRCDHSQVQDILMEHFSLNIYSNRTNAPKRRPQAAASTTKCQQSGRQKNSSPLNARRSRGSISHI